MQTSSPYVDTSGHIIPVLKLVEPQRADSTLPSLNFQRSGDNDASTPTGSKASPRAVEFAMTDLKPPAEVDSADSFGLMSPTVTEFRSSPFDRPALLAQLGMGSMRPQDDKPTRTRSLRLAKSKQDSASQDQQSLHTPHGRRLRGKISSPSLREQQQLRQAQTDIESKLLKEQLQRQVSQATHHGFGGLDDALMSPRATEFTQNPFATLAPVAESSSTAHGLPRTLDMDPRSPAQAGVSPITRNIGDVL